MSLLYIACVRAGILRIPNAGGGVCPTGSVLSRETDQGRVTNKIKTKLDPFQRSIEDQKTLFERF